MVLSAGLQISWLNLFTNHLSNSDPFCLFLGSFVKAMLFFSVFSCQLCMTSSYGDPPSVKPEFSSFVLHDHHEIFSLNYQDHFSELYEMSQSSVKIVTSRVCRFDAKICYSDRLSNAAQS